MGSRIPAFVRAAVQQVITVSGEPPLLVGPLRAHRMRGPRLDRFRRSEHLSGMGLRHFWRYACERFFILEAAMREEGLGRCLHIESDNLLYLAPETYNDWLLDTYGTGIATCPLTAD